MNDAGQLMRDIARYEKAYAESSFEPVQAQMRKQLVMSYLLQWLPRRVLEIGCGNDAIFNHYRQFDQCVVLEPGPDFAARARDAARDDKRIEVIEGFAEAVIDSGALAGQQFDCVLISGLLHELNDPQQLLAAVRQVAGPDTRIHVNVPNARSLHRLLAFEMGLINDLHSISDRQRSLQQRWTFDIQSLRKLCTSAGYQVKEEGSFFIKPFTHAQMYMLSEIGLLDQAMLVGLMRLEKHLPGMGSEIFVNLTIAPEQRGTTQPR